MWYVDVYEYGNPEDRLVKSLGPFGSERLASRVDDGVCINLDHDKYETFVRNDAAQAPTGDKGETE